MIVDDLRELSTPGQLASEHLKAMWYDLHGDWDTAHEIVQQMSDHHAMWIHAYLHRKEPDIWNAKYWYRACGRPYPGEISFEEEITTILSDLPQG